MDVSQKALSKQHFNGSHHFFKLQYKQSQEKGNHTYQSGEDFIREKGKQLCSLHSRVHSAYINYTYKQI